MLDQSCCWSRWNCWSTVDHSSMVASLCESASANFTISSGRPPHLLTILSFSFSNSGGMLFFKAWANNAQLSSSPRNRSRWGSLVVRKFGGKLILWVVKIILLPFDVSASIVNTWSKNGIWVSSRTIRDLLSIRMLSAVVTQHDNSTHLLVDLGWSPSISPCHVGEIHSHQTSKHQKENGLEHVYC